MPSCAVIEDFLKQKSLAVVGVSRNPNEFANGVFRKLKQSGYKVYPVNRDAVEVEGGLSYTSVRVLPEPVDGVLVMVPAEQSASVVQDCQAGGVTRVWLHRGAGQGAVSPEAVKLARQAGMAVVDGACPYMFLDKAVFHRIHRFFTRLDP